MTTNLVGINRLWTGGNQENPTLGWTWYAWPAFSFINWDRSEPNKQQDYISMNTWDGTWKTGSGEESFGVACKKPALGGAEKPGGQDAIKKTICENEAELLSCGPIKSFAINIKSAIYGRTSKTVCGQTNEPCRKTLDVTEQIKSQCNGRHSCTVQPSNQYGDPCPNIYKYMEVYFECVESSCFKPLLETSGKDGKELSASTGDGQKAFYKTGTIDGWVADAKDEAPWLQFTTDSDDMQKLWGLSTWGTGSGDDTGKWVTEYYIEFKSDRMTEKWYQYTDPLTSDIYLFDGNNDPFSEKHHNLKESFSFHTLRIRPTNWHTNEGEKKGPCSMRVEFYGCVSDNILSCFDTADQFISESSPDGTSVTKHCISNCRDANPKPELYGDGVYSGDSQICMSATHAGVIEDAYGGDVTIVKQAGQDSYKHSYKNGVLSYEKQDGYGVSFAFSEPTFNCPKGSKEFGDYCYAFYTNLLSWSKAEEECKKSWNGHLASIAHNNEQAFIQSHLDATTQDDAHYWIGLRDFGENGHFTWTDDSNVRFTNWAHGEPNNPIGYPQTCVQMYRNNGLWNDDKCESEGGFACKFERGHYPITDEGPDEGCEKGWSGFEDQCYYFAIDGTHSQEKAKEICGNCGAGTFCQGESHLAKIPDEETNAFIYSTLSQMALWEFWHGLENPSGDDQNMWFWQDLSVPTYTNWAPELPTNWAGQCSYFLGSTISNGKWYQDRCNGKFKYYICQKAREGYDPKPPPTKPPHPDGCPGSESDGWVKDPVNAKSDYCYQ